jgi:hypothetical protein
MYVFERTVFARFLVKAERDEINLTGTAGCS